VKGNRRKEKKKSPCRKRNKNYTTSLGKKKDMRNCTKRDLFDKGLKGGGGGPYRGHTANEGGDLPVTQKKIR